jgi:hypothetical protein
MVARTPGLERFAPPPEPWIAGRWRVPQFTRADAEAMVRIGIIPEDATTELLHGVIVLKDRSARDEEPTMIGQDHRKCVERLSALRKAIDDATRHVESQQPLVCSDIHQPEPDFMVLRGTLDAYTSLPIASDAFCVVEVADSSFERDAGIKLYGYARAGVSQYVIINLRNRTAEVYTGPDTTAGTYPPPRIVAEGQSLELRIGDRDVFPVRLADVLP